MDSDGRKKCLKYSLFVVNGILFLAGFVLIIAGSITTAAWSPFIPLFGPVFHFTGPVVICVGLILMGFCLIGFVGAGQDNQCNTFIYHMLIGNAFLVQFSLAIVCFVLHARIDHWVEWNLERTQQTYGMEGYQDVTASWDTAQKKLGCCGVHNYTDWAGKGIMGNSSSVPDSCCITETVDCGTGAIINPGDNIYTQDCQAEFAYIVKKEVLIIGGYAMGLAIPILLSLWILSFCLVGEYKKEKKASKMRGPA